MKRLQTELHAHTMRESKVIRLKKSKFEDSSSTDFFLFIDISLKRQPWAYEARVGGDIPPA